MCGICGFYQNDNRADRDVLKRMNDRIRHRGPDDEGFFLEGKVGLAARRLSIIDLVTGHQPLSSHTGNAWITFNGEVYNFPDLRRDLEAKGVRFRTKTDTEVVVNMYEVYGLDFVERLRGMFAIAIYDRRAQRLILARDHVGIKPLYYHHDPQSHNLVFGSEIKALLPYPGIDRTLDTEALDLFLTLEYIPAPFSLFRSIRKLPAGHILIFDGNGPELRRFWEVSPDPAEGDFSRLRERFLGLLEEAVKMRMIADVPLGAFLSGGIDSSAIVATMSSLSAAPIKTFSIGFEEKSYSELPYAAEVARRFGTDHHWKKLSPDIQDLVHYLSDFFDEPLGDFSNFPTYLVSKTAREEVTVVLSGDGGDEIFGGYEHYIAQKMARILDVSLFRPAHRLFAQATHLFPPSPLKKGFVNRIKRFSEGLENPAENRHFRWMIFLSNYQKLHLYSADFIAETHLRSLPRRIPFDLYFDRARRFSGINRDLFLDLKTYLVDDILVKVDRMSMATSLEARVPLLDHRMVEFAFSLPSSHKVRARTTKWFFKRALAGILPEEIIQRRKEGFSIPIKNWLGHELKDLMMEYLSPARLAGSGLFNAGYVDQMIQDHLANRQNHSHRLWALILFHLWRERYLAAG